MSLHEPQPHRLVNLTFHGVGQPSRPLDAGEEDVWVSIEQFTRLLDEVSHERNVRISFDDGNASDLNHALAELARRDICATFFVVAGKLGEPGFLSEEDVRSLAGAGMTIGCHGLRHRAWRPLGDSELHDELLGSKKILEDVIGRPVTHAACPFGSYDRRVLRALRDYGYQRVFTSDRGTARSDAWLQARNSVGPASGRGTLQHILALEKPRQNALIRRAKLAVKRYR